MCSPKLFAVIGLGKSGVSCVRYLKKFGYNVVAFDEKKSCAKLLELEKEFSICTYSNLDNTVLNEADVLVISPGISLKRAEIVSQIKRGADVFGDVELFMREAQAKVVGITGSNGKSTVTALVTQMAKDAGLNVRKGGNFGTPALDLLDYSGSEVDLYVLELSSFQLESVPSLKTVASVVLNISPDHMDRYESFEEYKEAKMRIYDDCSICVINKNDPVLLSDSLKRCKGEKLFFSSSFPLEGEFGLVDDFLSYGNKKLIHKSNLLLKGSHQIENVLASLSLGKILGFSFDSMINTLKKFSGLKHRCTWISKIEGVDWYDDSKGTNVGATKSAIEGLGKELSGKIVLIAGGKGKGADFSLLSNTIKKYVKAIITIGEDAHLIKEALKGACRIYFENSMEEAVFKSKKLAKDGDIVLLSPACASFDMFKNFEHRGDVFAKSVLSLNEYGKKD